MPSRRGVKVSVFLEFPENMSRPPFCSRCQLLNVGLLLAYGILLTVGFALHEMWRDEYEQLLFRRYAGFIDRGSPFYILYNFLCWSALQVHDSVFSFKAFHCLVALLIAWMVLWRSPFRLWEKAGILLSYFLLYEFSVIARYYGLIVLLVFATSASLSSPRRHYFIVACLMLAIASINPMSATFTAGFGGYFFARWLCGELKFANAVDRRSFFAAACLFTLGAFVIFGFFAAYVISPEGLKPFEAARPPLAAIVPQIWNAYVPIPDLSRGINFWWSNVFPLPVVYGQGQQLTLQDMTTATYLVPAIASAVMVLVIGTTVFRDRPVFIFYTFTTLLQLALIHFALKVYVIRYLGLLFITLIAALWLYEARRRVSPAGCPTQVAEAPERGSILRRAFRPIVAFILISQVIAGLWAFSLDVARKFSNSEALAAYVESSGLARTHALAGYVDAHTQCIVAENGVEMYFPQIGRNGRFAEQYNPLRKNAVGFDDLLQQVTQLAKTGDKPVALVLTTPIGDTNGRPLASTFTRLSDNAQIRLLQAIDDPVISRDELYWVYEITVN